MNRRPTTLLLTAPQLRELRALAREPQNTYGTHRTRVQNNLVLMRLAVYLDDAGQPFQGVTNWMGLPHVADRCAITDAGRAALAGARART